MDSVRGMFKLFMYEEQQQRVNESKHEEVKVDEISSLVNNAEMMVPDLKFEQIADSMEGLNFGKIEVEMKVDDIEEPSDKDEVMPELKNKVISHISEEDNLKIKYLRDIETTEIKEEGMLNQLKSLMDMGFLNFSLNYNLLKKHKLDLNLVCEALATYDISESMFVSHYQAKNWV